MRAILRPPQNLLELPYSFTQLPLLTPDEFLRAAVDRGLHATRDDLQALHRLGLLVPMFRVRRDGRAVTRAARRHAVWGRQAGGSHPTTRADLLEARARRALLDPLHEAFVGHRRMTRETYGVQYQASEYVYSHHQLSLVSIIRQLKPFLSYQEPDGRAPRLHQKAYWDLFVRPRMAVVAGLLVPLSALDPIYYPDIIGTFAGGIEELEQYHNWRDELGGHSVVQWLGVTPDWLKSQGQQLLHIADSIDPLGGWRELVREASPSTWKQLRGDARAAVISGSAQRSCSAITTRSSTQAVHPRFRNEQDVNAPHSTPGSNLAGMSTGFSRTSGYRRSRGSCWSLKVRQSCSSFRS